MKSKIFNLIILDKSGSMMNIAKFAVDGLNETINSIKQNAKKNSNCQVILKSKTMKTLFLLLQL